MACFDDSKFAKIDALFGEDDDHDKEGAPPSTTASRGGMASASTTTTDLHHRLLRVGNASKRKRREMGQDDEEGYDDGVMEQNRHGNHVQDVDDDDGEEEEIGRTAIAPATKIPTPQSALLNAASQEPLKKKKKKKGKKERQKESSKDNVVLDKDEPDDVDKLNNNKTNDDIQATTGEAQPSSSKGTMDPDGTSQGPRRRRKKVRSRQKNIVKDKRSVKPEHLTLPQQTGQSFSRAYRGRPLTAETRAKLGLPPSQQRPKFNNGAWVGAGAERQSSDGQAASGEVLAGGGFNSQNIDEWDASMAPLAVDAVENDAGDQNPAEEVVAGSSKESPSSNSIPMDRREKTKDKNLHKKSRKTKYKNIQ